MYSFTSLQHVKSKTESVTGVTETRQKVLLNAHMKDLITGPTGTMNFVF